MRTHESKTGAYAAEHWRSRGIAHISDDIRRFSHYDATLLCPNGDTISTRIVKQGRIHSSDGLRRSADWMLQANGLSTPELVERSGGIVHLAGMPTEEALAQDSRVENRPYNDLIYAGGDLLVYACPDDVRMRRIQTLAVGEVVKLDIVTQGGVFPVW